MRRSLLSLGFVLLTVGGGFAAVLATDTSPQLGLDLQGGVSVRLVPDGDASNQQLDDAVDIISQRVDALGVAEPDVRRQGNDIVVDIPGVENQQDALDIVGQTGELLFRPVVAIFNNPASVTTTTASMPAVPEGETTTTATTTTTTVPPELQVTPTKDDVADKEVTLPGRPDDPEQKDILFRLGTTDVIGSAVSSATAEVGQDGWGVTLKFRKDGLEKFNAMASQLFPNQPPQNQMAITLDGIVQSSPAIQPDNPSFEPFTNKSGVRISGSFSKKEARNLASVLRYGALPLRFDEDQRTVESVSPSLGKDQLSAGIIAGSIGLGLVALYMLLYYRLLSVVAIVGLGLSGLATYTLTALLSKQVGLTLSLAGVVGLIVSVGVTVDSYVVYFEKLKDEVRTGRTLRASLDTAFLKAWRTILAADLVSLIGAAVLYWLAVGNVRGFAFFLGLFTILDLIISYLFMAPLTMAMSRSRLLLKMPFFGIRNGLDARGLES